MERCGLISDQQSQKGGKKISPFSFIIMGYTVQAIQINKDLHFIWTQDQVYQLGFTFTVYKKIHMEGKVKC